mgnify:FL=1
MSLFGRIMCAVWGLLLCFYAAFFACLAFYEDGVTSGAVAFTLVTAVATIMAVELASQCVEGMWKP